jgi:hypothetical protein
VTRPILSLTNWGSRALHGSGKRWTIMAAPRAWEHGDGSVVDLAPRIDDLRRVRSGAITFDEYRARFLDLPRGPLRPWLGGADDGSLRTLGGSIVRDGDTLLCACSREAAAAGRCHRAWAADLLVSAGWDVVLDGRVLPPVVHLDRGDAEPACGRRLLWDGDAFGRARALDHATCVPCRRASGAG